MSLAKRAAAQCALDLIEDGMIVGLGTGSTSELFIRALGKKVGSGQLRVTTVSTSVRTERLAREQGLLGVDFSEHPRLDITVDGADEIDPYLNLIKGGGGALLREKLVAASSDRMIVIADESKTRGVPRIISFAD